MCLLYRKIPHSTRNQRSHKRRRWKHIPKMPHWPFWNDGIDILCLHYQSHRMCSRELSCGVGWGVCRVPGRAPGPPQAVAVLDLLCPGNSSHLPLRLPSCVLFRKIQLLLQCPTMNVIWSLYLMCPWITCKYVTANQAVIHLSQWVESKFIYKSTSVGIKIKFPFSTVTFWF